MTCQHTWTAPPFDSWNMSMMISEGLWKWPGRRRSSQEEAEDQKEKQHFLRAATSFERVSQRVFRLQNSDSAPSWLAHTHRETHKHTAAVTCRKASGAVFCSVCFFVFFYVPAFIAAFLTGQADFVWTQNTGRSLTRVLYSVLSFSWSCRLA